MKTQDLLKTVVAVPTHVVVVVARVAPDLSRVTFLKLRIMKCVKVKTTSRCKKKSHLDPWVEVAASKIRS